MCIKIKSISIYRSALILKFCLIICISIVAQSPERYEFSQPKMGTKFKIIFYCQSDSLANIIQDAAFEKIDELNTIYSDYEVSSELNKIVKFQGQDTSVHISSSLYDILKISQHISKETYGAFDVTIGPLSKLWRRAIRRNEFPTDQEIKEARSLVDFNYLRLRDDSFLELLKNGIRLDLGGIAKGATVDEVFELVSSYGITQVLVDGGGDIRVGAKPPDSKGWEIQLPNSKLLVQNTALATSGDTYKYIIQDGRRYAHIIDPRTGYGIQNAKNVMVQAANCTIADAIASAASILEPLKSKNLISIFDVKIFYDP